MRSQQFLVALIITITFGTFDPALGQSKTTEALHKKHGEALSLYFYNNTLRMLNQIEDKNFDELIKDIEKMKFIMIDKGSDFGLPQYKALVSEYKSESFDEIMTSRYQGKNFDVFLKDDHGKTEGMIITVSDSTNLYVLDIVGSVALDKITTLFKTIDESTDIREKIRNFTKKD